METALLDTIPVNSNATPEARELLQYLVRCSGTSILTGQHTQTNPMEEYQYIHEVTGHYPKVVGFEMFLILIFSDFLDTPLSYLQQLIFKGFTFLTNWVPLMVSGLTG